MSLHLITVTFSLQHSSIIRFERTATIPAYFETQAERFADRTAIHSGGQATTYRQLNAQANQLAHNVLNELGDEKRIVALLLEQGVPLATGIFGSLKSGQAFVPLDPSYPPARIQMMLDDARPAAIITNRANAEHANALAKGRPVIILEDCTELSESNPTVAIEPTDLAYLLYTSGSTGKPKGVMQDHQSVVHNMLRHREAFKITEHDRQTQLYPTSVYGGTRDHFNALLNGAAVYHYPLRDVGHGELGAWLSEHKITLYCSVATVFRHFARELKGENLFPDLRIIKLGGEAPRIEDIELFRTRFCAHTELSCGLGSTETGITRRFPVHRDTKWEGVGVPLGYGVPGVDVMVLDEEHKPVPTGEIGEIVIRSRYITRGYLGRDELNEQVLLPDPDDPDTRLFFTGDLGVMDEDGCLVHKGRKDHQVKIRGNRVELHEIETLLGGVDTIKDAVVVAPTNDRGDVQLVAYLVPDTQESPDVHAVREALKDKLPRFMIPTVYVEIEAVPMTPNGKLDRLALPKPNAENMLTSGTGDEASTEQERAILGIMRNLLNNEAVGVDDSFFDSGGDSLLAVQMVLEVEKRMGQKLPLASFTQNPSARGFSSAINVTVTQQYEQRVVALNETGSLPPLFCFPGRGAALIGYRRLAEELDPDRPVFGLQYPGLGGDEPIDDLEELASEMVKHLKEFQPDGPYHLYGYSFGGLVAYEAAQQITRAGGEVAFVGLLDTYGPRELMSLRPFIERAMHAGQKFVHLPVEAKLAYVKDQIKTRVKPSQAGPTTVAGNVPEHFGIEEEIPEVLVPMVEASHKARMGYAPTPYRGRVDLFRCQDTPGWLKPIKADVGWAPLVQGELHIHAIPGSHTEVFKPENEAGIIEALRNALDSLQSTRSLAG